jgi:hypothetical protein
MSFQQREKNSASPNRVAVSVTIHCLTGCAVRELRGVVIGTASGWGNAATIVLSIKRHRSWRG